MDDTNNPAEVSELAADADNAPELEAPEEADVEIDAEGNLVEEEDSEDVDYEGKSYKVPKTLKDALLRQADYTRKTQEVAQARQAFEAERQQHQYVLHLQHQSIGARAEATAIAGQLREFEAINWQALANEDPAQAQRLWIQREQLKERMSIAHAKVTQTEQQALQMQQQTVAKQLQEGSEVLARDIKGWSKQTADQLREYGKKLGYADHELDGIADARAVKLLHKAMMYDQMQEKAKTVSAKPKQTEAPKPVTTIKGKSSGPTGYAPNMTDAQFAALRRRQIAQRRG